MRRYASFEIWSLFEGESRMVVEFETVKCKFCDSENVVKNGRRSGTQYFICKNCGRGFVGNKGLPGMRYPVDAVSGAILNYYTGSSLNDIRDHIIQNYSMYPSDSTIYRWITEFSKIAIQESFKHTPKVGDTWIADETMLTIRKPLNKPSPVFPLELLGHKNADLEGFSAIYNINPLFFLGSFLCF